MFDHILNWRLLHRSHKFPGPDGGTCITEAAIVAAGFEYREVQSAEDCPPCFSPVIAAYAIRLNDQMTDDLRQELLLPFVTRLAGTADNLQVEKRRVELIVMSTVREILPVALRAAELNERAIACEQAKNLNDVMIAADAAAAAADAAVANAVTYAAYAAAAAYAAYAAAAADAANAVTYAAYVAADAPAYAAAANAANAVTYAANAAAAYAAEADAREIWTRAVSILDAAINLGKHEAVESEIAQKRMDVVRREREAAL
jgi:hypothetical protein